MNASFIAEISFSTLLAIAVVLFVVFLQMGIWASRYTKVGPNEVLIISGRRVQLPDGTFRGFRLVKGGGTFVWPVFEKVDVLSLELCDLELSYPKTFAADGSALKIEAQAQIKIKTDDASLLKAAERLIPSTVPTTAPAPLKGTPAPAIDNLRRTATTLFEKHLNVLLAASPAEEALRNPPAFALGWQKLAGPDFDDIGLEIVSLLIRDMQKILPAVQS